MKNTFVNNLDANIEAGDKRWIDWWGALDAGPMNTECFSEAEPGMEQTYICPVPIPGLTDGGRPALIDPPDVDNPGDDDPGFADGPGFHTPPPIEEPPIELQTPMPPPDPNELPSGPDPIIEVPDEDTNLPGDEVIFDDDLP